MNKTLLLLKGELIRLAKYKILFFGVLVSLIWVVIIAFSDLETAVAFVPFLVLMDAGLMSIILLAASYYLEKQEGSLQSVLVAPVKLASVLIAKVLAMVIVAMISFVLVIGAAVVFHDFQASIWQLFIYMLLVVSSHTAIGYVLTLYSKDFMQLLVRYMGIMILFLLPTLLVALEIIPEQLDFLIILSPSYAGQLLFQSAIGTVVWWKVLLSIGYLVLIPALLYPFVVYRRYEVVAMEG